MCKELAESGLPDPENQIESFMLRCMVNAADVNKTGELSDQLTLTGNASSGETSESSGSTDEHILQLFSKNPALTIPEVAAALRMTERGVEKRIAGLKKSGGWFVQVLRKKDCGR